MKCKVIVLVRARNETKVAKEFYKNKSIELLKYFKEELNKALNFIQQNPTTPPIENGIHFYIMPIFPYIIHYSLDIGKNIVYIYSLFNTHQNPIKKPKL